MDHLAYLAPTAALLLGFMAAIPANAADPTSAAFYVAPNGNDAWSGKLPAPNAGATDGPFATLAKARDALRALKTSDPKAVLTVLVRAGTYYLPEPLVFRPQDSGTPQRPVTYAAYPGEEPVLSGGRRIASEWRTKDGKIYTTEVPAAKGGSWFFRLLRVGDDWAIRARFPNYDPSDPIKGGWLFTKPCSRARGQFGAAVGNIHNRGDFMEWRVEVPATGDYNVFHYYAAQNKPWGKTDMGGSTTFTVDGGEPVVLENLQDTGSFSTFKWSARNAVLHLEQGSHTIRWTNVKGGGLNYDAFVLCDDPTWTPHGTPPAPPEGKHMILVHAETFVKFQGKELSVKLPASRRYWGFDPGSLKPWPKSQQIEMHVFPAWGWVNSIEPVAELDLQAGVGTLAGREANQEIRVGNRYFLENIFEELDMPGEWYLDSDTGRLYYWPTDQDFARQEIVAPAMDRLIDVRGDAEQGTFVTNLRFRGLTFKDTSYTPRIASPYSPPDGALWLNRARDCLVENCRFARVGGYGIRLVGDSRSNRILGNTVEYCGEGGVTLETADEAFPIENVIAGNHIHHCGLIYKHVAGVYLNRRPREMAQAPGNLIAHNLITDMPRYGIGIKMEQGNNVVEFNEIRRTNLETNDTGAIETCVRNSQAAGNTFRYNLVADAIGLKTTPDGRFLTPYYTWGIYLDDHSSNAHLYGNICVRNFRGGVVVHGGKNNVIENNILVDSEETNVEFNNIRKLMTGNRFIRNIVYRTKPGQMIRSGGWTDEVLAECDSNLYWDASAEPAISFLGKPLEEWRKLGYDQNALVEDPLFVDPASDDYRLKPDSPALKLGFKPIPVEKIGLKGYDRRKYAR